MRTRPLSAAITYHARRHRQRGVALLLAMLMVAMASVIATSIISNVQLQIRRAGNLFHSEQALQYALSGERFMAAALQLHREVKTSDDALDLWAITPIVAPLDEGGISARIYDSQGCFNLNSLVDAAGQPRGNALVQYRRLLEALELEPELADVLRDWMDADDLPEPGGAEEDEYLGHTPAYRTSNARLESMSELQLMNRHSDEVIETLRPHVCVLPVVRAAINVNFATAPVLQSLHEEIDSSIAEELSDQAKEIPFVDVKAFLENPLLDGIGVVEESVTVETNFYRAAATIDVGNLQINVSSLFQRGDDGRVRVVSRARGQL